MRTSITILIIIALFISAIADVQAQIGKKSRSNVSKEESRISISPYLLPRIDFIQHNDPVVSMNPVNVGVAGGLLFRLWLNQRWGVFTGVGVGKRQFHYLASGTTVWTGEDTGAYNWDTEFRHEKLTVEVQVGASFQHNFKKKSNACTQFGETSTGWFFVADLGILLAPEFRNTIFARGDYSRFSNNTEAELLSSASYPNWTQESEPSEHNETQVAVLLRPSFKYQMKKFALQFGPEFNLGLTNHKDLLNYRSNGSYKVHSLGLFVAAEF